jgi:hypothetical protein
MKNPFKIDRTNLIIDNGKIRNCTKNENEMSIWENMIFDCKSCLKQFLELFKKSIKDCSKGLVAIFLILTCLISFPTILLLRALITKHRARKEINEFTRKF